MVFETLGEIPKDITHDWTKEYKETRQYITYNSLKENFPKVFKIKNDFFAKILFLYLSKRKPLNTKVNF